ncbi:O-Antigen ligase [Halopseudomonas litoralis]|uniref:O-Antigen ligase n=1 Tax=Halopseudomonas litoralis TaxID=797277 RepID=A0A1H1P5P7_9GAMM|nr:O-antigen ligase family protein [Halopseudomonas litoralis]SDS06586.1 O-Antigen ligase [Halopseudomonas litoralis]
MKLTYIRLNSAFLLLVFLFVVLGNLPRFVPIAGTFGNLNASELVIYLCAAPILIKNFKRVITSRAVLFLLSINSFSLGVGIYHYGLVTESMFYNIRLSAMILSGFAAGVALHWIFRDDITRMTKAFVITYGAATLFSFILLIIYPDSTVLWLKLEQMGINFTGDPHQFRLVSTYLDPNFFGTIIVLPLLMATLVIQRSGYLAVFLMMVVALLFSFSRSGISLALLAFGCVFGLKMLSTVTQYQSKRIGIAPSHVYFLLLSPFLVLALVYVFESQVDRVVERFVTTRDDSSALSRLKAFDTGMDLIAQHPLLGHGYNFAIGHLKGGTKVDSSLQMVIMSYGLIGTLVILLAASLWAWVISSKLRQLSSPQPSQLFRKLVIYIVLTLLWAGHFNQIVFYPFWLLPVLALFFYFDQLCVSLKSPQFFRSRYGTFAHSL